MSGNIYISPPASTPTILNQDINLNSVLQGQVSYNTDINVFLEDSLGNPITPTGSVLVGNDLTATLATPNPSGVALQFPNPSQGISTRIYDTGWRSQNGWYAYSPPAYPAKYAQLDTTQGANQWYKLKTALTVNGVSNTQRFVDLSGVQGWAVLNNLNLAVLDKLTGLMITRNPVTTGGGAATWITQITTTAPSYSVVINGNTYSDWYVISLSELMAFFGTYLPASPNWTDPITGIPIMPANYSRCVSADVDVASPTFVTCAYQCQNASGGTYVQYNTNTLINTFFYVHDARNLIS